MRGGESGLGGGVAPFEHEHVVRTRRLLASTQTRSWLVRSGAGRKNPHVRDRKHGRVRKHFRFANMFAFANHVRHHHHHHVTILGSRLAVYIH